MPKRTSIETNTPPVFSPDSLVSLLIGVAAIAALIVVIVSFSTPRKTGDISSQSTQAKTEEKKTIRHTVIVGDTLWNISLKYYGSGFDWPTLQKINGLSNPDLLFPNMVLDVPTKPTIEMGQISSTSTERIEPKHSQITVQPGDTLWSIAEREYGNPYLWPAIAKENPIKNPDLIYPGFLFRIPATDSNPVPSSPSGNL
jgi:nucleoid-associated protein YgaU